jgi:autophagy-related protein 101
MNANSNLFEINCEGHQVSEAVSALFQSILFYRSYGKFQWKHDTSYQMGTVGFEEVTCDFIDFTYVKVASRSLSETMSREIREFVDKLRENHHQSGSISLEFFTRRKNRWTPFYEPPLIWEIWTLKINVTPSPKERVEEALMEKMLTVIQIINSGKNYLPPMPSEQFADTVFDTGFADVQPYAFRINYKVGVNSAGGSSSSPADASVLKRFIRDTFTM